VLSFENTLESADPPWPIWSGSGHRGLCTAFTCKPSGPNAASSLLTNGKAGCMPQRVGITMGPCAAERRQCIHLRHNRQQVHVDWWVRIEASTHRPRGSELFAPRACYTSCMPTLCSGESRPTSAPRPAASAPAAVGAAARCGTGPWVRLDMLVITAIARARPQQRQGRQWPCQRQEAVIGRSHLNPGHYWCRVIGPPGAPTSPRKACSRRATPLEGLRQGYLADLGTTRM